MSIINFQFGSFTDSSPGWFDWFNLLITSIITVLSIYGGYEIAKKIYNSEKKDKIQEDEELKSSEVALFKNSIIQLNNSVKDQLTNLEEHYNKRNFTIKFNQGIHGEFMNQINIKYLYREVELNNLQNIEELNKLLSNLYALSDFRTTLKEQLRTFSSKYNFHEEKFYNYRKLLYSKYFELCNRRDNKGFIIENGLKKWTFNDNDKFMFEYTSLLNKTFSNNDIIDGNGLKNRELLNSEFVIPLIQIAAKYIPEDYDAIQVSDIANEVNSAHFDMTETMDSHFQVIKSYIDVLKNVESKINAYLN